jgi:PAS domain S-box-containing protein
MNTLSIPVGMMTSISAYVGLYHLLIFLRRRQHRENLTFAILCFATSLYDIFCIGLYHATTVSEGVQWQRAQLIALALFGIAFLWFVSVYTHLKSRKIIYTFSGFYLLAIFIQLIDRSSLTWVVSRPSIKEILLPLGLKITYYEATFGLFTTIQSLAGLVAITYILLCGINFYLRGNKREASGLLIALGFMAAAAINDTAVSNGLYKFIYTIEYGYMAMILLMAFTLSNTIVEAAMAKESLRKSEERFRALVETTSDWVWETDSNGVYTYASPKVYELLGYEPQEIVGKTPFDLIPPDEIDQIRGIFQQIVANQGIISGLENTNRHKDGHLVILETSGAPFFDAKGNLQGYRGIDRNITERRIAEQALRESEKRFRTLAEASFEGIVLTEGGIIVDSNDQTANMLGYPRDELIGMSVMEAVALESRGLVAEAIRLNRLEPYEHLAVRKDGSVFPVEVRARTTEIADRLLRVTAIRDITERKRAEENLRTSMTQVQTIINGAPIVLYSIDRNGIFTFSDGKALNGMGLKSGEVVGKSVFDVYSNRPDIQNSIRRALDGETFTVETAIAEHTYDIYHSPLPGEKGQNLGTIGILVDVTERKRAEQALRQSRNLLQTVLDTIPARVFWKDRDLRYLGCNRPFALDAGVKTPDEMIGKDDYQMGWREQADLYRSDDKQVVKSGIPKLNFEEPQTTPSGGRIWLRTSKVPLRDVNGEIWGVLGTYEDITEYKQVESALKESEEKYRSIVENALAGIFTVDDAYHFVYANDELCRILSYPREELLGLDFRQVLTEESNALVADRYIRRQRGERLPPRYEFNVIRRDGKIRHVEMSVVVVKDITGRSRTIGQLVDITERKQVEAERERLIIELESKNAELERFTYTVSHDLKSPLVTIRGFLGFLEKNALAGNIEQLKTDIGRIRNATAKMQQLLNELLELSRIGRMMNPAESVAFEAIVNEAVELVRGWIDARGVQVIIMPDLPVIYGDRARLVEVLQNLIDNAVKFMGSQPEPRIEVGQKGQINNKVILYVKDNGIGIEPQYHDRVFGLFNKLDINTEGTGVGLALVKRIIEVHDGKIWVESEGGNQGATFYFTLPVG